MHANKWGSPCERGGTSTDPSGDRPWVSSCIRLSLDLNQHLDSAGVWPRSVCVVDGVCVQKSDGLCQKLWQNFEESVGIFLSFSKSDATLRAPGSHSAVEELRWV